MRDNHIFPFLWMRGEPEEVLRREIGKIQECGIQSFCVEARPHKDFCGPGWWHDMDIALDEAKKRGMTLWILDDRHFPTGYAAGLIKEKYPQRKKLYLACSTSDIAGRGGPFTLDARRMCKPSIGYWQIGQPVNEEERKNNRLLTIQALRFGEDGRFTGETLDLTGGWDGERFVRFRLPAGAWRVFVLYLTRTDGGNEDYINMLDRESAHTQIEGVYEAHLARYGAEFGRAIAGFFSDEPQFGNVQAYNEWDTQVGRRKMPLPWSGELEARLRRLYGDELDGRLPFLFAEPAGEEWTSQIRYDYMDAASRLYQENFSEPIGRWCREHGVEYVGHIVEDNGMHSRLGLGAGHYFRATAGQDMAGIDCIGGQIVYGAPVHLHSGMVDFDGEFFHYALGKLGASAGHLDPRKKGRTMCELFGAYGWGFGVRDMKYLFDHLLVKGVNYLVPHAFSMAPYPDPDCPPHFYAGGHNPQFPYFARLMQYADRLCRLFFGGQHVASVAVLYDGEADWQGEHMPMQKVTRALLTRQIDLDIVSLDMLRELPAYNGRAEDGRLYINGESFGALVVPYSRRLPGALADFVLGCDLPVYFVEGYPAGLLPGDKALLEKLCAAPNTFPVPLEGLADTLMEKGCFDLAIQPASSWLSAYHYKKDRHMAALLNESATEPYDGRVTLPFAGPLAFYDAYRDTCEAAQGEWDANSCRVRLHLEPGELAVLMQVAEPPAQPRIPLPRRLENRRVLDISQDWLVSLAGPGEPPAFGEEERVQKLAPISDKDEAFSGTIRYRRELVLEEKPAACIFKAEFVYEVMKVTVNGQEAGTVLQPPYALDIAPCLREGVNELCIEVATTPARDQLHYPRPPFDFQYDALEPAGMFGEIQLYI